MFYIIKQTQFTVRIFISMQKIEKHVNLKNKISDASSNVGICEDQKKARNIKISQSIGFFCVNKV